MTLPIRLSIPGPLQCATWRVAVLLIALFGGQAALANSNEIPTFMGVRTQFIAALGDPAASSGEGAETWGLWRYDPGPRGVWLEKFERHRVRRDGVAPANWTFDSEDWWLDENGLIMENPMFAIPPGRYMVTGDRETVALLTIHEDDAQGVRRWELDSGATLYDVTHLPCRSARYTPVAGASCSPANARQSDFPVTLGAPMPAVEGCQKQDYAVLFIVAVEVPDS